MAQKKIIYNAFTQFTLSHQAHGQWRRPEAAAQRNFSRFAPWVRLARTAERAGLDTIFFADTIGVYDVYRKGWETAAREGMQFPANDPASLVSALAYVTEHLGFIVTSSILQDHPFNFARKLSTLDHLSEGRVGWNIVTSYLDNAARNFGLARLDAHDDRYGWAEEYTEVVYKLWEASWQDDAVVADLAGGVYADPARIHPIRHEGPRYRVDGPHMPQPSPQRTPLLAQAGASGAARAFAARHAEMTFLPAITPASAAADIADLDARLGAAGRRPGDLKYVVGLHPIIGSTQAEARVRYEEFLHWRSEPGYLAHASGSIGFDLSEIDPDTPLAEVKSEYVQGGIRAVIDAEPDKQARFGDVLRQRLNKATPGTPEQIADTIGAWVEAGVDGFNLIPVTLPDWFDVFADEVVPILRKRGLIQSQYRNGTLREKLFGAAPTLPDRHPARRLRPWAAA
ncbi:NtaA/DmoA family FMN-dependent monooxygenase [Achromobacter ruhlandii]|uniref:NtaA/DmoA family FMN-dependent monooxygenase n=1 Tax=Achromobacter ruhlandii TaxID=72557 RepID=UPI000C266A89|nr:NtaA/DmoA family FMN-dependent monooxygenase [Achromobacter ruhlandii]PJM71196.1 LLM class flavin-dependent oxidoreductase [Achromobacter ruhlandii]